MATGRFLDAGALLTMGALTACSSGSSSAADSGIPVPPGSDAALDATSRSDSGTGLDASTRLDAGGDTGSGGADAGSDAAPRVQMKFQPLDCMLSDALYGGTLALAQSDIDVLKAYPGPNTQCFATGYSWGQLETGAMNYIPNTPATDAIQYAGFAEIEATANYLWAQIPGAHFLFYISGSVQSGGASGQAPYITTHHFGQNNHYMPRDITNCGGSLTVANTYGSSSTTTYPVAPMYVGASYYGLDFYAYSGGANPYFSWVVPSLLNHGINQRWIQLWQALSHHVFQSGPFAGKTVDEIPLIDYIAINDEYSYDFNNNVPGVTVNPPASTSSADAPTKANFYKAYFTWATAVTTAFPHTLIGTNFSWGFSTNASADSAQNLAADMNDNMPNNLRSNPSERGMSSIRGLAYGASDVVYETWESPFQASPAQQGFVGISNATWSHAPLNPASYPSLKGIMPAVAQIQPNDYDIAFTTNPSPRTQGAVLALMKECPPMQPHLRLWCAADAKFVSDTNAWSSYVQPALLANAAYPPSPLLPESMMFAPKGVTQNASGNTVTISWDAVSGVGSSMSYDVLDSGLVVGNSSANSLVLHNVAAGAHSYTVRLSNANGTGPQSSPPATLTI